MFILIYWKIALNIQDRYEAAVSDFLLLSVDVCIRVFQNFTIFEFQNDWVIVRWGFE